MKEQKKEPWRIVVGIASMALIVYMWAKKDIAGIYASMPAEQALPMVVTTLAVSLVKVGLIAAAVYAIKWIGEKIGRK